MKQDRRILVSIIWLILGIVLSGLSIAGVIDAFWGGMGSAFLLVGILQMVRFIRLRKDPEYREKREVEVTDERNRFIRNKAWAWAGYLFVLIAAVASIGLKLVGQELLSKAAGLAVCLIVLLYWGSYLLLRKKY